MSALPERLGTDDPASRGDEIASAVFATVADIIGKREDRKPLFTEAQLGHVPPKLVIAGRVLGIASLHGAGIEMPEKDLPPTSSVVGLAWQRWYRGRDAETRDIMEFIADTGNALSESARDGKPPLLSPRVTRKIFETYGVEEAQRAVGALGRAAQSYRLVGEKDWVQRIEGTIEASDFRPFEIAHNGSQVGETSEADLIAIPMAAHFHRQHLLARRRDSVGRPSGLNTRTESERVQALNMLERISDKLVHYAAIPTIRYIEESDLARFYNPSFSVEPAYAVAQFEMHLGRPLTEEGN